jgi:chromosome segregation ATPase
MTDYITFIKNSCGALEKLNAATSEIMEYQQKIKDVEQSIDEYNKMIPELKKLGYYKAVSACARNLMKQADLLVEYQNQIDHIQKYIDNLFEI